MKVRRDAPPMRLSPCLLFLLVFDAGAADSSACAGCHAGIWRQWRDTPMARSSGVAGEARIETFGNAAFSNARGTAQYSVSPKFTLRFAQAGVEGERALNYFLGAGNTGRSYLTSVDGFFFQAPVAYYRARAAWDLSPGYERAEEVNLARETGPGCLRCHVTGLRPVEGTSNGFSAPPWRENGVGCERCHGGGEDHIRGNQSAIVNPAKLTGEARDSVCAQCHLPGAVEIAKAGNAPPYVPGARLSDSVAIFVLAGEDREANINGHFEQLSRSLCMRSSGGKLWCGTCHRVHATTSAKEKPAFYRQQCLACHAEKPCTAATGVRAAKGDDCVACHMTQRASETVQHAAVTDHRISRLPRAPSRAAVNASLAPFGGEQAGDRELGLAYASVALQENNRAWGLRAFELLRKESAANPRDAKVASSLAQLYDRMNRDEDACRLYETAVGLDPNAAAAKVNLAACRAKQGKVDEALALWSEVLKLNPSMETARLNYAVALFRTGRKNEAKASLNEALRFNPASRRARELLAGLQ